MPMQLKIGHVADKGDLDRERLVLHAKRSADIGDFLLIRTGVEDGEVTTDVRDSFWFPDRPVKAGTLWWFTASRVHTERRKSRVGGPRISSTGTRRRHCGAIRTSLQFSCTRLTG